MGELADAWSAAGRPNLWGQVPEVVELQSGGDAEYLADETFSLVRCEFCDDLIDATGTWHLDDDADRSALAATPAR